MIEQLRFNICKLEDSRLANDDVKDLASRIKENISDTLQYSALYWANHLCFTPDNGDRGVWETLKKFFEGPYALFWIEVLSIIGMLRIGVPSLRKVMSTLIKVSLVSARCDEQSKVILTQYRRRLWGLWKEFKIFVVSSPTSALPSLSALHTSIFQQDHSYPRVLLYQLHSVRISVKALGCKEGNCRHGQRYRCNGLDIMGVFVA